MADLEYAVHITDPKGNPVVISPGDPIPGWALDKIDAHCFVDGEKPKAGSKAAEPDNDGPPPQSGKGSGKDAWVAYAEANDVEVADDATKDDIIAACESAGVAVTA